MVEQIIAKARMRPELAGVNTTIRANGQQLLAEVDRAKAEVLGVPVQNVYSTLQTMFGSLYVSQFLGLTCGDGRIKSSCRRGAVSIG